jgi:hypothetical protein
MDCYMYNMMNELWSIGVLFDKNVFRNNIFDYLVYYGWLHKSPECQNTTFGRATIMWIEIGESDMVSREVWAVPRYQVREMLRCILSETEWLLLETERLRLLFCCFLFWLFNLNLNRISWFNKCLITEGHISFVFDVAARECSIRFHTQKRKRNQPNSSSSKPNARALVSFFGLSLAFTSKVW